MSRFSSILALKDTPIVLGVVLALAAWMANRLVEAHTSSPLVEYSMNWLSTDAYQSKYAARSAELLTCSSTKSEVKSPAYVLEIPIRNLSTSAKLEKLHLEFGYPPKQAPTVLGIRFSSKAPASAENDSDHCGVDFAVIKNLTFQPGAEYTLLLGLSAREEPFVLLSMSPGETPVRVQESNTVTRLIRYQSELILSFLAMIVLLAMRYLYLISELGSQTGGNKS